MCGFDATVSIECRTTDDESKWVISDDLQVAPLGAARQRPKGGEVLGRSELVRRAYA